LYTYLPIYTYIGAIDATQTNVKKQKIPTTQPEILPTTQISDNADHPAGSVSTDANIPSNTVKNEKSKLNFHGNRKSETDKTGVKPAGGTTGTSSGGMDALFWAIGMNE
jgi:hypothetical protein